MTVRQDVHSAGIPVLCQSCEARHHGVCGALDPGQLVGLAKTSSKHTVEPGVELIGDAATVDSYSNVLSGVVKLTKSLSDGRQQIVGLQFAPDFFLWQALQGGKRHQRRSCNRSLLVLIPQGRH